jgi:transketolase
MAPLSHKMAAKLAVKTDANANSASKPINLRDLADAIRRRSLDMIHRAKSSHVGSVFSAAEILAVLYGKVLRVRPNEPKWEGRDRFVMSKGHAAAGLYVALAERGFFPADWLDKFYLDGTHMAGHVTHSNIPGVEVSTGSLGHGLAIACGMAISAQRDNSHHRVFALLSDGECDEGSTWEAALFAPHHKLENLTVIVDYNKIQSLGTVKQVLDLEPFADKWKSFGWATQEIDGHKIGAIEKALARLPLKKGRPTCIIAHTVKGKGVDFMEDKLLWHYRCPSESEMELAVSQLEGIAGKKSNGHSIKLSSKISSNGSGAKMKSNGRPKKHARKSAAKSRTR